MYSAFKTKAKYLMLEHYVLRVFLLFLDLFCFFLYLSSKFMKIWLCMLQCFLEMLFALFSWLTVILDSDISFSNGLKISKRNFLNWIALVTILCLRLQSKQKWKKIQGMWKWTSTFKIPPMWTMHQRFHLRLKMKSQIMWAWIHSWTMVMPVTWKDVCGDGILFDAEFFLLYNSFWFVILKFI